MEGDFFASHLPEDDDDDYVPPTYSGFEEEGEWEEWAAEDAAAAEAPPSAASKRAKTEDIKVKKKGPSCRAPSEEIDFQNLITSWSIKHLMEASDTDSRALLQTDMGLRPNYFSTFTHYCTYWYTFAAEEARCILRGRLLALDRGGSAPLPWQNRLLQARFRRINNAKSGQLDVVFHIMNQSFFEHGYSNAVYAIGSFPSRDSIGGRLLGIVPPSFRSSSNEICLRINKNYMRQLQVAGGADGDLVENCMFTLFPLVNLNTTYRSAIACCDTIAPYFSSKLLGLPLPKHIRFDKSGLSTEDAIPVDSDLPLLALADNASSLNASQRSAMLAVMTALDRHDSITMVQGPPGTGKTHFVSQLLLQIVKRKVQVGHPPRPRVKLSKKAQKKLKRQRQAEDLPESDNDENNKRSVLATGPSNKSVVVMLEKFLSFGGCQNARVVLFGVDEKLEEMSSGRVDVDVDVELVVSNTLPPSILSSGHSHGNLTLSELYNTICNPRSITDLLARQIPDAFARAMSQLLSYIHSFCEKYRSDLGAKGGEEELQYITREYVYTDLIFAWMLPEKAPQGSSVLKKETWSQHELIKVALASLKSFSEAGGADDSSEGQDEAQLQHELFAETLRNVANYLSVLVQRLSARDMQEDLTSALISQADVVFATLSSAGNATLRRSCRRVDIVLCDEAAQASEAATMIPLALRPKHLILVGDPAQLPAYVDSAHASRMQCEESLMRRLMGVCGYPSFMLQTQYRMHPEIVAFPNESFYRGCLETDLSVLQRAPLAIKSGTSKWLSLPFAFLSDEGGLELGGHGSSFSNQSEAHTVVQVLKEMQSAHSFDISKRTVIITFYAAQVELLRSMLRSRRDELSRVKVATVDSVQGSEYDFVILSFVRSNESGNTGFLKNPNRLNVSLTRAKLQLLCVGSISTIGIAGSGDDSVLARLVADAKARNLVCFLAAATLNQH